MSEVTKFLRQNPEWDHDVDLIAAPPSVSEALKAYPELEGSDVLHGYTRKGIPRLCVYYLSRRKGASHRFAEMCACQQAPGCMTDSVFFADQPKLCDQFVDDTQFKKVLSIAKKHGYKPNTNDVYVPGLARFQGDPEAFVPPSGGRGYIKKVCERRGWECDGAVKTKGRQDEVKSVPLANDIVDSLVKDERRKGTKGSKRDLVEKVVSEHGMK